MTENMNQDIKQGFEENKIKDSDERSKTSKKFATFGTMSAIFAAFYVICFYKAGEGISVPIFAIGNAIFILIWIKKLGMKNKKETWFYLGSAILLGISVFLSANVFIRFFSKTGMLILWICFMIYQLHDDSNWGFSKYVKVIFKTIGKTITKLHLPIVDLIHCTKGTKHKRIKNILTGIIISVPLVTVVLLLLSNADAIFANMFSLEHIFKATDISNIVFLFIFIYFIIYAFMNAVERADIETEDKVIKKSDPVIAVTFTSILSVIYLVFSGVQIFALFLGKMELPKGYNYAEYAREGFFQLLAICIINMLLVLFCLKRYEDVKSLRIILTFISICTYIIIASSAFRMAMYVKQYKLSFLRILVFWMLVVMVFLMLGVMIRIYTKQFPAFRYSMVVITICYMVLAFMKPDFIIAKYNLNKMVQEAINSEQEVYYFQDIDYVYFLSSDIMPAIRDFVEDKDYLLFKEADQEDVLIDLHRYLDGQEKKTTSKRNFNIAKYIATKDAAYCEEKLGW